MALQTIAGGLWLPNYPGSASNAPNIGGSDFVMDAASERVFAVFSAPKTGNISKVGFRVQTVTSAPTGVHDIRIETVDATTGLNTGTLVEANANATTTLDTVGWKLITLTDSCAVTAGQIIAVGVVAPAANFGNIALASYADDTLVRFPYTILTSGVKSAGISPIFTFEYSDGSYECVQGIWPYSVINSRTTHNSGSAPDRRGLRFRIPFKARLAGCWVWTDPDGDFDIVHYAADGTTATVMHSHDKDIVAANSAGVMRFRFATTKTIEKNTDYRLVVMPTTATNVTVYDADVNAAADLNALEGGSNFHLTTANDTPTVEGDWTQTLTARPFMGLYLDQFDDAVQVGGGSTMFIPVE